MKAMEGTKRVWLTLVGWRPFRGTPGFALLLLVVLTGCTVALEPPHDKEILAEVEALTKDTQMLFAKLGQENPATGYADRKDLYLSLEARARTIKLYANARPSPSGRVVDFFSSSASAVPAPSVAAAESSGRTTGSPEGERYGKATVGYMDDYLSNLARLSARDREEARKLGGDIESFEAEQAAYLEALETYRLAYLDWINGQGSKPAPLAAAPVAPKGGLSRNFIERRQLVLEDILLDALFYEREILNRNR
ncbi:hypothetical protein ACTL6U_05540 [Rhodovibrionaceae bacterium A322]